MRGTGSSSWHVTFDLTAQRRRELGRVVPILGLAFFFPIVLLAGVALFYLGGYYTSRPAEQPAVWVLAVVGLVLLVFLLLYVPGRFFPAKTIELDYERMTLVWASGHDQTVRWSDPNWRVTVRDFRVRSPFPTSMVKANEAGSISVGGHLVAWVPGECIDQLLEHTKARGSIVQEGFLNEGTRLAIRELVLRPAM